MKIDYEYKRNKLGCELSNVTSKEVTELKTAITKAESRLRNLQKNATSHQAKRLKTKDAMQELIETNEEAAKVLKPINRKIIGRPRVEENQPGLLSAMADIVDSQCAADNRRRTEVLRTGMF